MKILVVDDDREDAALLCEAVREIAPLSECHIAHSATEALALVERFNPQFVFIDAVMYPIDGKEVLKQFSQQPGLEKTTFIVMSGVILPEHHNAFTALGANFVLTKPSNYSSLLAFVRHIIEPSIVNVRVKLITNESLIHEQTALIENLVNRDINFEISMNEPMRHNIQFVASEKELETIKSKLGYNLQLLKGGHWLPHM